MARHRYAPLQTEKVETTWSDLAADYGAANVNKTIAIPGTNGLEVGNLIKWVYIEFNCAAQTTTNPKVLHWGVYKIRTGQTIPNTSLYNQAIKAQILKRGMEMLPSDVATVYKRTFVVKLPRGIQRFRDGDSLVLAFRASSTETINNCGFTVFRFTK